MSWPLAARAPVSPAGRKRAIVAGVASSQRSMEATMSTEDDEFRATDSGLFGFLADHDDDDAPFKPFGVVGYGFMTGVLGFSGGAHPEGPIQQNSYSFHAWPGGKPDNVRRYAAELVALAHRTSSWPLAVRSSDRYYR